jgi:proteasome lid subunit RPN8/RPN11
MPREACGVLLAYPHASFKRVIELPNHSTAESEYEVHTGDILEKLTPIELERLSPIAIWHTHPSGFIGPSADDLRTKVAGIPYLVISMTAAGPVATWF